jgi:site-specific recombinase XerD
MIENFFTQAATVSRLQSGLLGPHLPAVASALDQMGYSPGSIRLHLRAADHFGTWLMEQQIEVHDINDAVVGRYLLGLGRLHSGCSPNGRLPHTALGLRQLLEILQHRGAVQAPEPTGPQTVVDEWLGRFDGYLDRVAGCALKSRDNYLRYARRLLHELFGDAEVDWSKLQATIVTDFVRREAGRLMPSACGQPVTAIRSLIRFLVFNGLVSEGLVGAVPAVLTWRHSSIPRAISDDEVERVIATCDSRLEYGLREKAIVLLLARLGLRAREVIRLRIEDIDWVRGCVLIRAGKTHRERALPLSQEVGDTLAAYLRRARPASTQREVFLRWKPPFRPLRSSTSICTLTQKLLKRTGISVHRPGAHVLRHSLATAMLINGASFKTVADVLGHQSLATTEIYAKLDLRSLSQVAMPWPGGRR